MNAKFKLSGMQFKYRDSYSGDPRIADPGKTERRVELPWAFNWCMHIEQDQGNILEVGNVLNWYYSALDNHDVVDKYELGGPGDPINEDIVEFEALGRKYDLIVSVSTFEHLGRDYDEEQDPSKGIVGVQWCINELLAEGGVFAFTIPYPNPPLSEYIRDDIDWYKAYMYRDADNNWEECDELHARVAGKVSRDLGCSAVMFATYYG